MINVMLVDNEHRYLDRLRYILSEIGGYNICGEYINAFSALEAVKEKPPDILITDILVAGMSGIGLALQVKELYPKICIVLMTDKPSLAMEVYEIGAAGIITKPLSEKGVVKTLRRLRKIG